MTSNCDTYIGVDLHKKSIYVTVMKPNGEIARQTEIENKGETIKSFFTKYADGSKIAVESTMNWIPFYERLESLGCSVSLSNPLMTKAIAAARIKNDKVDSRILADLLRTNLLPMSYIQTQPIRDVKEIVRERYSYVQMRTKVKNNIHSILFKAGVEGQPDNLFTKKGRKFLTELEIRNIYRQELNRYLETLTFLDERISGIENTVRKLAQNDYDCKILITIPGIGYYSALMIKSEIGDIERFPSAKKLCAYAGLIPSTYASADKIRTGRITKRGSKWLRKTLVDSITSGSRKTHKLSTFYRKLKKNKGTGKAKVATARKLCSIIFAMLKDKQPYREFVPTKHREDTPLNNMVN
ncbi:IS110 family transposase [Candidatus Roizmanbacteria bacterium]|nr:IS110 family transposase [Candidatus Roizmanbacteria bacterium]